MAEIFNLIPQDIGRSVNCFSHTLYDKSIPDSIRDVINTETTVERNVQNQLGQWFLLTISPYLSRGNVDGAVVTLVDVTSLKETSDALRMSEERFELAVRGSHSGIWDWPDVSTERIWCSDRMMSLLRESHAQFEFTISKWREMIHSDDASRAAQALRNHLELDQPYDIECRLMCGDGIYRWFHIRGAAQRSVRGLATRMAGSIDDITDRQLAEEQVKIGVTRRDQFLAMLSHELRNPLGAISNAAAVLSAEKAAEMSKTNAIHVMQKQVRQMSRLMDDLLDVSRITHGKIELRQEVIDINRVARDALATVQPELNAVKVTLRAQIPDTPIFINGDASRLEQVVVNLLNNAVKYTPLEGQIELLVTPCENQKVQIQVRDNGIGIPLDKLDEVFTLFYQADSTLVRAKGGMGIGLTLVKSIVELHDGTVTASSDGLNRGSCFTIQLPTCDHPAKVKRPTSAAATNTSKPLSWLRMLMMRVRCSRNFLNCRDIKSKHAPTVTMLCG